MSHMVARARDAPATPALLLDLQAVQSRLRSTMSPHNWTGYEVFWKCPKSKNDYAEIVHWDGTIGNWTSLQRFAGPQYGVGDGDIVEATIVGNLITGLINGAEVISTTDGTYAEGSPGVGFNFYVGETNVDHGFTSFEVDTWND